MYAPQPQHQAAQQWAGHGHHQHAPAQYRLAPTQDHLQAAQNNQYAQYQHPPPQHQYAQQQQTQLRPDRPEMAPIHPHYNPQQHQEYRLPPVQPQQFYQAPPMQEYRQHAAPVQAVSQSAPRQRTAIACKYCRRRKIRCSGFDNSEDGRCTNCARFNQECIFTPVSAQTQAFVPAQALYNANNRRASGAAPPQLYGSYGQPLPPKEQYNQPPPSASTQSNYRPQSNSHTLPGPSSSYTPRSEQPYPPRYSPTESKPSGYFAQPELVQNRRRKCEEPHTPVPPPQNPGYTSELARRDEDYRPSPYPHPAGPPRYEEAGRVISPTSSTTSPPYPQYHGHPEPLRRTSTNLSNLSGDYPRNSFASRPSLSPPEQSYNNDNYARHGLPPMNNHSSSNSTASSVHAPMSGNEQQTPPTPHTPANHGDIGVKPANRMSISGIIDSGPLRSAADKDMLTALNRPRGL